MRAASLKERGDFQTRDLEVFRFLWDWKMGTTQAIAKKFWPGSKSDAAYVRLLALQRRGYIRCVSLNEGGSKFAWTLTKKGFVSIVSLLPTLKEDGFRSESLGHDHLVMACHLGEWLTGLPTDAEVFSEQQIRRIHFDSYPSWVPRTELHRPDGYWRVPFKGSFITIALEVELSFKSKADYQVIAQFYSQQESVYRIIWVSDASTAKSLHNVFKSESESTYLKHDFLLLEDFKTFHWQAPIIIGAEQGKTLAFVLRAAQPDEKTKLHCPYTCNASAILDTQKRRASSTSSSQQPTQPIAHCMALPAIQSSNKGQTL